MTTKTIKTVLFSTLILSLVIPIIGMNLADAKSSEDKLADDKLLKRQDSWKNKYENADEFDKSERSINTYVTDKHPDNPWNKFTKKNQIKIYNFDTLAGERQAGLQSLLIDVQNQKANNTYNPTEAEKRFHNWAAEQISNPVMPDMKPKLIEQVIEAYNGNANYGNVPQELIDSDVNFWSSIISDKFCEFDKDCPKGLDFNPNSPDCGIVQCAFATTWNTYHTFTIAVDAYSCETGSCHYGTSWGGVGTKGLSVGGGSNHATSKTISYNIFDQSYVPQYGGHHNISGIVSLGSASQSLGPQTGTNSALISGAKTFSVSCGSDGNCGVYALSATAQNVTFVT